MKIENCKLKIAKRRGFTLIEILVTIFVLGIGLIGALSFFNINLNSQFEAKNELIAAGLAQEGADLVRNKIDFEKLKGTSWASIVSELRTDVMHPPPSPSSGCTYIDYKSLTDSSHSCSSGSGSVCFSGGRYQQCAVGITGMGMKRTLTIKPNPSGDGGLLVQCDVTWNSRTTTAKDVIYGNSY